MGTKVAPSYACLFMGWLEKLMLKNWSDKDPNSKPYLWRRYIDDIFLGNRTNVDILKSNFRVSY